jgi:hypothetical protein
MENNEKLFHDVTSSYHDNTLKMNSLIELLLEYLIV